MLPIYSVIGSLSITNRINVTKTVENYLCLMHCNIYELIRTFNILLSNDSAKVNIFFILVTLLCPF